MAMSAEHITNGYSTTGDQPPGAPDTTQFEVIDGSEEPFFNPQEGGARIIKVLDASFDTPEERFKEATHATYLTIAEIVDDDQLPPESKSLHILAEGVGAFFAEVGLPAAVIEQEEARKLLELARRIAHLGLPKDVHEVTRELMLDEIQRLTQEFDHSTPLHAFDSLATKSMRSNNERVARECALALHIWILEHSPNRDEMPSHYDRLRDRYLA